MRVTVADSVSPLGRDGVARARTRAQPGVCSARWGRVFAARLLQPYRNTRDRIHSLRFWPGTRGNPHTSLSSLHEKPRLVPLNFKFSRAAQGRESVCARARVAGGGRGRAAHRLRPSAAGPPPAALLVAAPAAARVIRKHTDIRTSRRNHSPKFQPGISTLVKVNWTRIVLKAVFRMSEDNEKVTLRRIEPAIQKFIKVAIPTDLERLRKHQINIEKYQRCRLWDRLHEEHINAGRTVQQLRANMREMEKLCLRVRQEDIPILQRMINPVKEEASFAIKEFLQLHSESAEELKRQLEGQEDTSLTRSATVGGETLCNTEGKDGSQSLIQMYSPLPEIPQDENAAESWENLEEDLIQLNQLVTEFSLLVSSQQEKIDRIEAHVNSAAVNVEEGTKNLGKQPRQRHYRLHPLPQAGLKPGQSMLIEWNYCHKLDKMSLVCACFMKCLAQELFFLLTSLRKQFQNIVYTLKLGCFYLNYVF
ncbi:syntaxin-17 isoform X3 [Apteryx mantelli]|uniref:Syntaxin-17 isoform X3 n=1 Tax=Apteryx mantelli TaxID=2696672 RepID=A0ABM4E3B4_9AVES